MADGQGSNVSSSSKPDGPLVSVLMPVYNTPAYVLNAAIASVLGQSFESWELCICDDCSTSPETLSLLDYYRGIDSRVKIIRSPRNLHISGATNLAASEATGRYIGFLDHDDVLETDALLEIHRAVIADPTIDVVYSDEDKIEEDGTFSEPYLKPDWSPEHLCSVMYMLHFFVVKKSLFLRLGGLREAYTGAQDYDLALRATAEARKILHIRKILYHWRKLTGSAAAEVDAKPQALLNGLKALESYVHSKDQSGQVAPGQLHGTFRVRWSFPDDLAVTLVILTGAHSRDVPGHGRILLVEHFVQSIFEKTSFKAIRVLVVDDGELPRSARRRLTNLGAEIALYDRTKPFNYAHKVNFAFSLVKTEQVVLLNDDLEVITPEWIEELMTQSHRPEVGAVGAKLLYPNERIQHAGIVIGVNETCGHIFYNQPSSDPAYCGFSHLTRNYSAVTGAVMATRLSVFLEMGGFDTKYSIDFNDIDYCLRLCKAGYRVVFTPHAQLYHFENSSIKRVSANTVERDLFLKTWGEVVADDPYYNPRLPRNRLDCGTAGL